MVYTISSTMATSGGEPRSPAAQASPAAVEVDSRLR